MSPIVRQGILETALAVAIVLGFFGILYLAGDASENWWYILPLAFIAGGIMRTTWREHRYRQQVGADQDDE